MKRMTVDTRFTDASPSSLSFGCKPRLGRTAVALAATRGLQTPFLAVLWLLFALESATAQQGRMEQGQITSAALSSESDELAVAAQSGVAIADYCG